LVVCALAVKSKAQLIPGLRLPRVDSRRLFQGRDGLLAPPLEDQQRAFASSGLGILRIDLQNPFIGCEGLSLPALGSQEKSSIGQLCRALLSLKGGGKEDNKEG
jgi:hypothetical protein